MMEKLKTDEQCDKCKKPFEILVADLQPLLKGGLPILCDDCRDQEIDEQVESMPHRVFEYNICPENFIVFNDLGADGWELVTVYNGMAYFKRECLNVQ